MSTVDILQTYSDIFILDTIFHRTMRELGWLLVTILSYIIDAISTVTSKLFVLDYFYNNPDVVKFIDSFKPLIVVLFGLSFCIIGYQLMFTEKHHFRRVGVNILIALTVVLLLPMAMEKMNAITTSGVTAVMGQPQDITNTIIKENVTDLLLYDSVNFDKNAVKQLKSDNKIDEKNIRYIDSTALIETGSSDVPDLKNKEVFENKLTVTEGGKVDKQSLNQGWMTWWKEYYYRYYINFLCLISALAVVGATLVFTCFKLGKIIFELAYNKLLAILVAPADIGNGQRTKQIVQNIFSMFIVTFLIAVLLKFYILFVGLCAEIKGIQSVILMIAGSFAVIEGPNIVERIFGVDAGLHSGFKTIMSAYLAGKAVTGGASALGKTTGRALNRAGRAGKKAGNMAGALVGGTAGVVKGLSGSDKPHTSMYDEMQRDRDSNKKPTSLYEEMEKDRENRNKNGEINRDKGGRNGIRGSEVRKGNKAGEIGSSGKISRDGGMNGSDEQRPSLYKEMEKDKGSNGIRNAGGNNRPQPSLYEEMNGEGSNKGNRANRGNAGAGRQSIYEEMGGSSEGGRINVNTGNTGTGRQSIYEEMGNSGGRRNIGYSEQPPVYKEIGHSGSNEGGRINVNTGNTGQTIGQAVGGYAKGRVREVRRKVENNDMYNQTKKSYGLGKNTGRAIRNKIDNKLGR